MTYNIDVNLVNTSRLSEIDFDNIPFGRVFSDHIFIADYYDGAWRDLRIAPYQPLSLNPATAVLHYSQTIFEGMKVMANPEGTPLLFRPEMHAKRLNRSAQRMAMPDVPEELFMQALYELIGIAHRWIHSGEESALYVRPVMVANDPSIGVRPAETYKFIIFTAPVGAYYSKPVKLTTLDKYVRAVKGGTGFAKAGGNYAASLLPQREAQEMGFDQVMWLDSEEKKYIHECGTMNLFFIIDGKVITPSTEEGTILEGITRERFIHILRDSGYTVEERPITIQEVIAASENGTLQDMFGAGTAAVVASVELFHHHGTTYKLPPVEERLISKQLKLDLNNLRSGKVTDKFGWTHPLKVLQEVI